MSTTSIMRMTTIISLITLMGTEVGIRELHDLRLFGKAHADIKPKRQGRELLEVVFAVQVQREA